jgi:FAD synthase
MAVDHECRLSADIQRAHRTIETYLLSALDGAAAREISVEFLRWVRDERKFENPEALKAQILRDVNRAQTYFRRLGRGATVNTAAR